VNSLGGCLGIGLTMLLAMYQFARVVVWFQSDEEGEQP